MCSKKPTQPCTSIKRSIVQIGLVSAEILGPKKQKNSLPSAGRASRQLKLWLRRLLAAERAPQLASAHRRHLGHILGWRRDDATFSPKIRKKRRPTRGFERGGERFQPRQLNLYVEYFR